MGEGWWEGELRNTQEEKGKIGEWIKTRKEGQNIGDGNKISS